VRLVAIKVGIIEKE